MEVKIRHRGLEDYSQVWQDMRQFTEARTEETPDELWVLEHPPVYTLGLNGDRRHILADTLPAPVITTDRGGQVTYHGPGQLVIYTLLDLNRRKLGVRALVTLLEQAVIRLLLQYGLRSASRPKAPGVYVDGRKIASLGLRVRRGCSYHGLSLNVDLDTAPFAAIAPCGQQGLEVTSLNALGIPVRCRETAAPLLLHLIQQLDDPASLA